VSVVSAIGIPLGRLDGRDKVTGRARYSADVQLPGTLWGAVLRSPVPHARVIRIDTSRARALRGVHAVLTGADLGGRLYGRSIADAPILAYDRVRFVGEPVAAVAAVDRDTAEEALTLVEAEYEELPAVFDPLEAMRPEAPVLHPAYRSYHGANLDLPDVPNLCSYVLKTRGDVEQGFREADLVLEHSYQTPMQHQGYIEPHSCLVSVEADGVMRVWASNKAPFAVKLLLARDLALPPEQVILEPTFVGGDFGGKGSPMQMPLGYFLSQATGRPVRLIMGGPEEMRAANPRHASWITIRSGLRRDGTFVARHVKIVFASGAYAGFKPIPGAVLEAENYAAGVYRIPHTRVEYQMVYTNHVPCGHMRSPGGPQAVFAGEVDVDRLAAAVGLDPLEFRLRNGVEEGDVGPLGEAWTAVRLKECLQTVRDASNWDQPKPPRIGRGVAVCQSGAGYGGSSAEVQVHPDGTATLLTGVNDHGSGAHTVLVQIVAHELQLPLERVRLVVGSTDAGPWDSGSSASRVTYVAGQSTLRAATEVREKLAAVAAEYLGCPERQVELVAGAFRDREQSSSEMAFEAAAARACRAGEPLSGYSRFENWDRPSGTSFVAHVAEVEVDPETGQVHLRRVVAASDVGTVLNPIGVTGQLEGALVMGLGAATMEELPLLDGQVAPAGLHDYKLPTARDLPSLTSVLITDGEGPGPYGAKGVGELGHLTLSPALANAVNDAIGVHLSELPLTAERVYRALEAARVAPGCSPASGNVPPAEQDRPAPRA
jgi:CO/xanthine dehydrogenase Mo-binding subunit